MGATLEFADDHQLPASMTQREDAFDFFMQLPGISYRKVARRETLKVVLDGRSYFIKKHFGVGWLEIFKNWMTFKRPVVSAQNEVAAIAALTRLGIPTTPYVGHGMQGCSPAALRSFVLTEDLGDIVTLEDLASISQQQPMSVTFKRALIKRVAEIAGTMHTHGIYHRDFYICHFCIKREEASILPPRLHVLDLHRVEIKPSPSVRMQVKDLAALYFSAMDCGLSRGDRLCFFKHYAGLHTRRSLKQAMMADAAVYRAIEDRAHRLYRKFQRKVQAGISM